MINLSKINLQRWNSIFAVIGDEIAKDWGWDLARAGIWLLW